MTARPVANGMTVDEIVYQKRTLADLMSRVLKEEKGDGNGHYGTIPGCGDKKVLYKSGAEIIALSFGVHPEYEVKMVDLGDGHREYQVECKMFRNIDGMRVGSGVGMCSTMEKKYRWRYVSKLIDGKKEKVQIENPNIEDQHNTVLKMAKKRAYVDAVITTTGASDFVTQDLEDFADVEDPKETPSWVAEIEMIDSLEELSKYWKTKKVLGKDFAKKITERKKELEKKEEEKSKK